MRKKRKKDAETAGIPAEAEEETVETSAQEEDEASEVPPEEDEDLDRERQALEKQRQLYQGKLLELAVAGELQRRGISPALAQFVAPGDPETVGERIDRFEELFRSALTLAVTERMRGTGAPREPARAAGYDRERLRQLSPQEINAHWEEISQVLRNDS